MEYALRIDHNGIITIEYQGKTYEIPDKIWTDALEEVYKVPRSELKALLPEAEWYQIPYPFGIPNRPMELESKLYRLFDGSELVPNVMSHIDALERRELFASLSSELFRVRYHYDRFGLIIDTARRRKQALNARVSSDLIMRYSYYEASSMMASARTVADQLVHICLRINWDKFQTQKERKQFTAVGLLDSSSNSSKDIKISIPEIAIFRKHESWFVKLNTYRNVMVHQGWKIVRSPGYYEPNDELPESKKIDRNPLFMPDDTSLASNARPHLWTYQSKNRLDDFLNCLQSDIEILTDELITNWGATVAPPPKVPYIEHPNIIAMRHFVAPILDGKFAIVPLFSEEPKVEPFYNNQTGMRDSVLPYAINANRDTDGMIRQGYHFQFANVFDIIADLKKNNHQLPEIVLIVLDPLHDIPTTQQKILTYFPFQQAEHDHKEGKIGKGINLDLEALGNLDRVFAARAKS